MRTINSRRARFAAASVFAGILLTVASVSPASARTQSWTCASPNYITGSVTSSQASTQEFGECNSIGISAKYATLAAPGYAWTHHHYSYSLHYVAVTGVKFTQSRHTAASGSLNTYLNL